MTAIQTIETMLQAAVGGINAVIWNYLLVGVLPLVGLYFSARLGFIQLRRFPQMLRVVFAGGHEGSAGISPFEALCTSLASRIGTGNLVGVAIALGAGGAGAIF